MRLTVSSLEVTTAVQEAMEEALTRILTPKRSIDMLRDIRLAKAEGRPYVTVFVGVNGELNSGDEGEDGEDFVR